MKQKQKKREKIKKKRVASFPRRGTERADSRGGLDPRLRNEERAGCTVLGPGPVSLEPVLFRPFRPTNATQRNGSSRARRKCSLSSCSAPVSIPTSRNIHTRTRICRTALADPYRALPPTTRERETGRGPCPLPTARPPKPARACTWRVALRVIRSSESCFSHLGLAFSARRCARSIIYLLLFFFS